MISSISSCSVENNPTLKVRKATMCQSRNFNQIRATEAIECGIDQLCNKFKRRKCIKNLKPLHLSATTKQMSRYGTSPKQSRLSLILYTHFIIIILNVYLIATINGQQRYNDVMPQQSQHNDILYFSVEENRPNQTFVGQIRSSDGQIPYLILPVPQTPEPEIKRAFYVNFTSGDLITNSILDREHREQYQFVAIVREPFREIMCYVTIKDANDNAPMFLTTTVNETNFVIDIPEGQRGVRRVLPLAVDLDTPLYGIKEFRIISGNTPSGTFHLVEHEAPARSTLLQNGNLGSQADDTGSMMAAGADNPQLIQQLTQQATVLIPSQPLMQTGSVGGGAMPSQGSSMGPASSAMANSMQQSAIQSKFLIDLEVSQPLDRENQSSYQLVIEAIDGGQPPQFGRLMVTVNVQDINDNDPVFHQKLYERKVNEDAPKGALLVRVQADDGDLESNGQVSYFIKRHTFSSQQVNSNSSDYNNEVATGRYATSALSNGKQRAQQSQNGMTQPPSSGNKQSGSQRSVNTDGTGDSNLPYVLKTRSSYTQDPLFEIDSNKGEIYLANQLDFETDQLHELLVEARDHGKPSRSSYTTVKIHVIDVPDDPPAIIRTTEDRRQIFNAHSLSDSSKAEQVARPGIESIEPNTQPSFNFNNLNLSGWFAQMNSSILFVIVFVALVAVAFPVCLVKIKSRQPESDYNDTAGLTLASSNGQAKPSPNHSSNNMDHSNGMIGDMHHRHHEYQRRINGSFSGLNGTGVSFGAPNGKISRHQYSDSSNLYHNAYPPQQRPRHHSSTSHHHMPPDSPADHQMAEGGQESRGGTMNLLNHHHHQMLGHTPPNHHSLDHHHQFAGPHHTTSSLTYAHHQSRAAMLHQSHLHRSSHQLSSVHKGMNSLNKGGTMNSVGTQNSALLPSRSPMPATPNTTHSSGLPPNMHDGGHHAHLNNFLPTIPQVHQVCQLPPTPNHNMTSNVFAWPPQGPGSTVGCYPGVNGTLHETPGSTADSFSTPVEANSPQPLDRWPDLGVAPQLVNSQDWYGSYNWDYLDDWTPRHHTLMPLIQAEASLGLAHQNL